MSDFARRNAEMQAAVDPDLRALIEAMKDQLLMVLINRLGGEVMVPVEEIDGTGGLLLLMEVHAPSHFVFKVRRKQ